MNEKLQQAILAARNGQETEAQMLLTQVLKENPDETQAWFLLSTLVDSESKKAAYLGKVLTLEPEHQMAQKMLARLQRRETVETEVEVEEMISDAAVEEDEAPAAPVVVSQDTSDFLAQQKGDTLPAWLVEEEGLEVTEETAVPEVTAEQETATDSDMVIPDWLQDEVPESWSKEAPAEETELVIDDLPVAKTKIAPPSKSKSVAGKGKQKQRSFLTGILYALIVVAVFVVIAMIYLAWNTFF
ncbi:MAG: hypothetical protein H6669_18645 [Ardenticatenaceae bacterium]|nr:hypothetical protein [Ardenticatenaceae bacterium]